MVDADGNPITRYTLFDTNGYGHWVINGVAQASSTAIDITAAQLSKTSYVFGSAAETLYVRINNGAAWGGWQAFTASPYVNHAPVVTTQPIVAMFDTSLNVSYLFSAADPDGDAITKYQLWDSTPGSKSGHWVVNGVAQGTGTAIDVTADQLAHTSFHTAITGSELLWARAFDGVAWSDWKSFTITVPADGDYPGPTPNHTPVVTAQNTSALHGQSLAASALFSAQDIDGDAITWYEVWDSTDGASSGSWVLDGVRTQSKVAIEVAADQLANLDFLSGSGDDHLWARAFDGREWSDWIAFHVTAPLNQRPVVTASNVTAAHGQNSVLATDLFGATDADGDSITRYSFWDTEGNGHWLLNGVVMSTNAEIDIAAGQLAQMSYVFGSATDTLYVRANDGAEWGAWQRFTASPNVNQAPVVTVANRAMISDDAAAISALVSAADPDGDSITRYQLWDSTSVQNSGHWVVNGVAQAAHVAIDVSAEHLAQTSFHAGTNISDQLWVRAFDGTDWGVWQPFTMVVTQVMAPLAGPAPVVSGQDTVATHGQSLDAASLFAVSGGGHMTRYEFWDSTSGASSGHWVLNGVATQSNVAIEVTAAELASTSFQSGSGADQLWVRAYDGFQWSKWSEFHVTAPVDAAPVAVASDFSATHNQNIAASTLFSVIDAENDSIAAYQFWDSTANPASGHWSVNGVAQSAGVAIDVAAAQLSQTTFQSGSGSDDLWVRVNDGMKWSDWKPFHVNAPVDQAPVVTASNVIAAPHQTVAASSFFTASDPDGDAIIKYQLWDSSADATSGHWTLNGIAQAANSAIDVTAAQLADAAFHAATAPADLWVRASDGTEWSPWQEFHLLV
ncbi:hypothetical protein [Bradyrhizobium sp. AUGA SZCCT0274]|uniref:hypothetical protein n=1 Tax=Bradyrhizobium sp. AUGA SZCCT0274 TaxID=2807670 RepID=UPI0020111764|nr:hypothetical protein [Bradyrhizobium sp. AUGA SZCCT0274]